MRIDQVHRALPKAVPEWVLPLLEEMPNCGIDTPNEDASFLAQIAQETSGLTRFEENMHYGAARLVAVWPRRFYLTPDNPNGRRNAVEYAHQPMRLAEFVYGDRMENGPEGSGDGWKYHGRGHAQLTGRKNYRRATEALGIPLLENPELMLQPEISAKVAGWYWKSGGFDAVDDDTDVRAETRMLNGGTIGLQERQMYFDRLIRAARG